MGSLAHSGHRALEAGRWGSALGLHYAMRTDTAVWIGMSQRRSGLWLSRRGLSSLLVWVPAPPGTAGVAEAEDMLKEFEAELAALDVMERRAEVGPVEKMQAVVTAGLRRCSH